MTKPLTKAAKRRLELVAARAKVVPVIVALEKKYGVSAVGGAFSRHQQVRRERQKLEKARADIEAKIRKLRK